MIYYMKEKLNKNFSFNEQKPFIVSDIPKVKELLGETEKKNKIDEKKLFATKSEKLSRQQKKKR